MEIGITIKNGNGEVITLTDEEVRSLYMRLKNFFGESSVVYPYPVYPYPIYPNEPWITYGPDNSGVRKPYDGVEIICHDTNKPTSETTVSGNGVTEWHIL